MLMQIEITQKQFIFYVIAAGAGFGLLFGLVVLFLGLKNNKRKFGVVGLICSTVAGGAGSLLLAAIVAGIFIYLILKKPEAETIVANDAPAETSRTENFDSDLSDAEVSKPKDDAADRI